MSGAETKRRCKTFASGSNRGGCAALDGASVSRRVCNNTQRITKKKGLAFPLLLFTVKVPPTHDSHLHNFLVFVLAQTDTSSKTALRSGDHSSTTF